MNTVEIFDLEPHELQLSHYTAIALGRATVPLMHLYDPHSDYLSLEIPPSSESARQALLPNIPEAYRRGIEPVLTSQRAVVDGNNMYTVQACLGRTVNHLLTPTHAQAYGVTYTYKSGIEWPNNLSARLYSGRLGVWARFKDGKPVAYPSIEIGSMTDYIVEGFIATLEQVLNGRFPTGVRWSRKPFAQHQKVA